MSNQEHMPTNQDRPAVQDHPTAAIHRMIAARKKPAEERRLNSTDPHAARGNKNQEKK